MNADQIIRKNDKIRVIRVISGEEVPHTNLPHYIPRYPSDPARTCPVGIWVVHFRMSRLELSPSALP